MSAELLVEPTKEAEGLVAEYLAIADRLHLANATLAGVSRVSLPTVIKIRRGHVPRTGFVLDAIRAFVEGNASARARTDVRVCA